MNLLDLEKDIIKFYQGIETLLETNGKFIQENSRGSDWNKEICYNLEVENRCLVNQRNNLFELLWHYGIDPRIVATKQVKEK